MGAGVRQRDVRSLTARSGLRLSLCDTARMTPARQPRQQRPLCLRSGCTSSPTATHRNRFPTSSGRVSTAIAVTAGTAAASSAAREPTKSPSYRPPMLRIEDLGTAVAPRVRVDSGALRTLCPQKGRATSVSVLNTLLDSSTCSLRLQFHRKKKTKTDKFTHDRRRVRGSSGPLPLPRRGQYYSASPSTSVAAIAPRVSFRRRGLGEGASGEGRRNHRRRKIVPAAAAVAAGPARMKNKEWGGRRECTPSETLLDCVRTTSLLVTPSGSGARRKRSALVALRIHFGSQNKL